jgi:hypothetical protein
MFRVTAMAGSVADRLKISLEIGSRQFGSPMGRA